MAYTAFLTSLAINYTYPRAILISGIQQISQSSCVQFEAYIKKIVSLHVRVPKCIKTFDSEGSLLTVTEGLGDAWHKIWLPLIVSAECDAQLQFEVVYDTNFGMNVAASLTNVLLNNGNCFTGNIKLLRLQKLLERNNIS